MTATTATEIAQRIRQELDQGLWAPGDPLRQEELADRYGASRIPVREALHQLQAEGLVDLHANRGAVIARLGPGDVNEIFELRQIVESYLLVNAIPRHDAKTLARVASVQDELEVEDERIGWLNGDRQFHERLYEPAGKARALRMASMLRGQVERFALRVLTPNSRRLEWAQEHRALIDAVRRRDADGSVKILALHLDQTRTAVLQGLETATQSARRPAPKP